jgi:hypothetical protein
VCQRAGFEELPARLKSNHGFDGVFVKYGADGKPTQIIVNELKFAKDGNAKLSNTDMGKQMSDRGEFVPRVPRRIPQGVPK